MISYGSRYKLHPLQDLSSTSNNNSSNNVRQHHLLCHQALMLLMMNTPNSENQKRKMRSGIIDVEEIDRSNQKINKNKLRNSSSNNSSVSEVADDESILRRKFNNSTTSNGKGISIPVLDYQKHIQELAANRGSFSKFLKSSVSRNLNGGRSENDDGGISYYYEDDDDEDDRETHHLSPQKEDDEEESDQEGEMKNDDQNEDDDDDLVVSPDRAASAQRGSKRRRRVISTTTTTTTTRILRNTNALPHNMASSSIAQQAYPYDPLRQSNNAKGRATFGDMLHDMSLATKIAKRGPDLGPTPSQKRKSEIDEYPQSNIRKEKVGWMK